MQLIDLLQEIGGLGLYDAGDWQRYLGFFPDSAACSRPRDTAGAELTRRIVARQGADCDGAQLDPKLSPKIVNVDTLAGSSEHRQMTLGVVSGAFDLLHLGHLECLDHAYRLLATYPNGRLCVLTISDQHIRAKKGGDRPVLSLTERLTLLAGVELVEYVVPLDDPDCLAALERLQPELFCKPEDDLRQSIVRQEIELVRSYGGRIELLAAKQGRRSTTSMVNEIRQRYHDGGEDGD